MSAESFASTVLWLTWLAFPIALFALGNAFRSALVVGARALVAIAVGWALAVAYVMAAQALVAYNASPERLMQLANGDSAPRAFAATLGWVPAAVSVFAIWLGHIAWRRLRPARHGL